MTIEQAAAPQLDINAELGAVIQSEMFRRRITGTAMGEALGIGRSTVSAKLRGKVSITVSDLYTIGRVLGMDPADLLCACRDSNPKPSVLYPVAVELVRCGRCGTWCLAGRSCRTCGVNAGLTPDRRTASAWGLAA